MSEPRVFGRQVLITFSGDNGTTNQFLFPLKDFSFDINDVVKKNSSLGESGVGDIAVLNEGGSLSFKGEKGNSDLAKFFHFQNKQISRGGTPYYTLFRTVEFVDKNIPKEIIKFTGVAFMGYNNSVSGNNEEVQENFKAEFKNWEVVDAVMDGANTELYVDTANSRIKNGLVGESTVLKVYTK